MIKSFADKDTRRLFEGQPVRSFRSFAPQAERRLSQLDVALSLESLRHPPGNRLEALTGSRQGYYSIRINRQWRLCFRWSDGHAFDVEITDYH